MGVGRKAGSETLTKAWLVRVRVKASNRSRRVRMGVALIMSKSDKRLISAAPYMPLFMMMMMCLAHAQARTHMAALNAQRRARRRRS
jgi:hypothetical protein